MTGPARRPPRFDDALIADVRTRLAGGEPVRRSLPGGGRLSVDRQLPFLVIYRPPPGRDDPGTRDFVRAEASYLLAPDDRRYRVRTRELVREVARVMAERFGRFLVVELWAGDAKRLRGGADGSPPAPSFRVVTMRRDADSPTVRTLVESLGDVVLFKQPAAVDLVPGGRIGAHGAGALVTAAELAELDARAVGVEISPVYRDRETGDLYPIAKRHLVRQVSRAVRMAAFEFARTETTQPVRHYQALGSRALSRAVWDVDTALADLSAAFDLLLFISPTNADAAYAEFKRSRYERPPTFIYRPRHLDPAELKRRLYAVDIGRVEDPTMAHLFREKRSDLDLKISLLLERESPRFLPLSVALYGRIDAGLRASARALLAELEPEPTRGSRARRSVPARVFVARAEQELARYRQAHPAVDSTVEVRDDLTALMVSAGRLLVGRRMTFHPERVEALIQHEVGTHLVTHWNGRAQPLKLLSVGLAHYDELQEGLGVFAEYLAGGLTAQRMRTLAARVLAADHVLDGAGFVDTWRLLTGEHGFGRRAAFLIAMRVHRSGGFVKDSIYLRGVQAVLDHLAAGGQLDSLLVGKLAVAHAPIIEELQRRGVLAPAPLRPAYLDDPDGRRRLDAARRGLTVKDLVAGAGS